MVENTAINKVCMRDSTIVPQRTKRIDLFKNVFLTLFIQKAPFEKVFKLHFFVDIRH